MIDGVIAPVLQVPPTLPVSSTLPPVHNDVEPFAEMTEAVGSGLTVTMMWLEFTVPHAAVLVTK